MALSREIFTFTFTGVPGDWDQWRALVVMVMNFRIWLSAEQLSASPCSLFSDTYTCRVLIGALVFLFIILRSVALWTAALAAGPCSNQRHYIGGEKNPFYITHDGVCLTKESFLAPLLANEAGKMGLWIELVRSIKMCALGCVERQPTAFTCCRRRAKFKPVNKTAAFRFFVSYI